MPWVIVAKKDPARGRVDTGAVALGEASVNVPVHAGVTLQVRWYLNGDAVGRCGLNGGVDDVVEFSPSVSAGGGGFAAVFTHPMFAVRDGFEPTECVVSVDGDLSDDGLLPRAGVPCRFNHTP
jgi:hypothetical protein